MNNLSRASPGSASSELEKLPETTFATTFKVLPLNFKSINMPMPLPIVARSLPRALAIALLCILTLGACSDEAPTPAPTPAQAPAAVPAVTPTPVSTNWLADARVALKEGRLISPAGNNAIEFYLAVPAGDPGHTAAQQALLELTSPASASVESNIEKSEFGDIPRQIDLLKRMGASDLRLGPLRTQFAAAQKAKVEAELEAAKPPERTPAPTTVIAPVPSVPAPITPLPSTTPAPIPQTPPPQPRPTPAATTSAPPPATSAPVTASTPIAAPIARPDGSLVIVEARQTADAAPAYPPQAARRRVEGMVELEFTVGANGQLSDVSVVRSSPPGIFDREALRASQRWRFSPRTEDGKAVSSKVRKTLNFRLKASG